MMSWLRSIANCNRMRNEKECVEVGSVVGMLAKRTRGCGEALEMISLHRSAIPFWKVPTKSHVEAAATSIQSEPELAAPYLNLPIREHKHFTSIHAKFCFYLSVDCGC